MKKKSRNNKVTPIIILSIVLFLANAVLISAAQTTKYDFAADL